jgi:hypothetical protein
MDCAAWCRVGNCCAGAVGVSDSARDAVVDAVGGGPLFRRLNLVRTIHESLKF